MIKCKLLKYLLEKSSAIDTDEERLLAKKASEMYDKVILLLNKEQEEAMEKYIDALCDIEALFAKKAFCKGCEFASSFLLECTLL